MKFLLIPLILIYSVCKAQDREYVDPQDSIKAAMLNQISDSLEDVITNNMKIEVELIVLPCPDCRVIGMHGFVRHGKFIYGNGKRIFVGRLARAVIINVIPWAKYQEMAKPEE